MSTTLETTDLAFEGAVGFGAETTGGRGGEIVKVTTLADSGEGSLRWALEEVEGPRIVVFEVSGEIALKSAIESTGDVTIAGQTSPNGVTLTGAKLRIMESNVIVRGMQFRPGDGAEGDKGDDRDGLSIGSPKTHVENVIVDSNSFSWSIDEQLTLWYGPSNVTISNNIFAEALKDSIHSEGDHSMGILVGDGSSNVTLVGNLLAHNEYRNIQVKDDSKQIEFVNNLIYNYGPNGFFSYDGTTAHVIGNVYIPGQDSAERGAIQLRNPESGTAFYLEDNIAEVEGSGTSKIRSSHVFEPSNVTAIPSSEVMDSVLANAGARYPDLNATDARIIQSVIDGTGRIIDSQDDVGGYHFGENVAAPTDSDDDGIPDVIEAVMGTNANRFDAHGDANGNGISNIEDYLNGLITGDLSGAIGARPGQGSDDALVDDDGNAEDPFEEALATFNGKATRVEAEDLRIVDGFEVKSNGAASGAEMLQVAENTSGKAKLDFDGAAGVYDLVIGYFDENDGASELTVRVNGKTVDNWTWDQNLGSAFADGATQTEHVVKGLELEAGDVVTFVGTAEGKEPLRLDYVDLQPTLVGQVLSTGVTEFAGVSSDPITIEAETMTLEDGWKVRSNPHASEEEFLEVRSGKEASASTVFQGQDGIYDISVDYFDESDGVSFLEVMVGGEVVDSWHWNAQTGAKYASQDSLMRRVIEDVHVANGEAIVLQGYADKAEPLRIDAIELVADSLLG